MCPERFLAISPAPNDQPAPFGRPDRGGPIPQEDRRAALRYRVSVRVGYLSEGKDLRATVYDLGAGGVFVCTARPLELRSDLDLAIHLPGDGKVIQAEGQVVWTNLVGTRSVPAGMGIRFTRIDPEARERLQQRLDSIP